MGAVLKSPDKKLTELDNAEGVGREQGVSIESCPCPAWKGPGGQGWGLFFFSLLPLPPFPHPSPLPQKPSAISSSLRPLRTLSFGQRVVFFASKGLRPSSPCPRF